MLLRDLGDDLVNRIAVPDIEAHAERCGAKALGTGAGPLGVDITDDDGAAVLGEAFRDRGPNAAGCPGNEGNLAAKARLHSGTGLAGSHPDRHAATVLFRGALLGCVATAGTDPGTGKPRCPGRRLGGQPSFASASSASFQYVPIW